MKIDAVDIFPFDVRLHEPFRIATMVADHAPNMLVRVRTDDGVDGWGEASPFHAITGETQGICIAAARELRPLLVGRDPLEIGALVAEMDRMLTHNTTAKSAFDMALYDIAAQAAGMPLWRFLGGTLRPMETDLTIGIGDPAAAGDKAFEVRAKGFRIIKVKVGMDPVDDGLTLCNIRSAVGLDAVLRIDGNQGYDRMTAVHALDCFADLDIQFCEQPVVAHDVEGLKWVGDHVAISLMADEALFGPPEALRLAEAQAAPYWNIKLSKAGGIRNATRIAAIAEAAGVTCMIGCMLESRLGLAAAAHFACSTDAIRFYDLDTCFEHSEEPIDGGIRIKDGMISLPDRPGIGARPSAQTLKRLVAIE